MPRSVATVLVVLVIALAGLNVWQWRQPPPTRGPREIVDEFTDLWSNDQNTWFRNSFMGIPTWQNPMDVWVTLEIIHEVKPDVIVEAGTFKGGSAALWAMYLEEIVPDGRVITIDIQHQSTRARVLPINRRKVDFLIGSSTSEEIVDEVRRRTEGKRVLVILDSNHQRDHVLGELRAYAPMVEIGSYVIVQDSAINGHPVKPDYGPGPYEAIEAFLAENDDFEADRSRERLLFTANPMGYLKRVR